MVYALYQWSSLLSYSAGWFATTIVVGSYHTLEPSPSIGHQFITSWCLCHRTPWISYCNQPPSSSMIYIIYTSLYAVDRPLLAVENRTMVLSQRQNSTSYAQKSNMPYTTTSPIPPTNFPDRSKAMRQKGIYNIEWVLRWRFSSYHCEPNVQHARCTYHKWNWEIFQLAAHNNHPHRIALAIHEKNNIILSGHWESGWHAIYGGQTYIDAQSDKCKMSVFFSWLHITINLIPQRENWWLIVNWYDGCSWFVSCPEWWLITSDYHRSTYISIEVRIPKC